MASIDKVVLTRGALNRVAVSPQVRGVLRVVAEHVAASATQTAGTVDGEQIDAVVLDDTVTSGDGDAVQRRRLAVLAKHRSGPGRQAGAYALLAAIDG